MDKLREVYEKAVAEARGPAWKEVADLTLKLPGSRKREAGHLNPVPPAHGTTRNWTDAKVHETAAKTRGSVQGSRVDF